jgi:hypothetical protein
MRWAVVRGVIRVGGGGERRAVGLMEYSRAWGEGERGGEKRREVVVERREESADDGTGGGLGGCGGRGGGASCTGVLNCIKVVH